MASLIWRRDDDDEGDDSIDHGYWDGYYSPTAEIIKWVVVVFFLLVLLAYFVGGYYHAQKRMKKGLPPLAYHRASGPTGEYVHTANEFKFLVSRRQRAQFEPQPPFSFYQGYGPAYGGAYPMNPYPPPPPPYNPQQAAPPGYQPPEGGSKVNPEQGGPSVTVTDQVYPGPSSNDMHSVPLSQNTPSNHNEGAALPPRDPPKPSLFSRLNPLKSRS